MAILDRISIEKHIYRPPVRVNLIKSAASVCRSTGTLGKACDLNAATGLFQAETVLARYWGTWRDTRSWTGRGITIAVSGPTFPASAAVYSSVSPSHAFIRPPHWKPIDTQIHRYDALSDSDRPSGSGKANRLPSGLLEIPVFPEWRSEVAGPGAPRCRSSPDYGKRQAADCIAIIK